MPIQFHVGSPSTSWSHLLTCKASSNLDLQCTAIKITRQIQKPKSGHKVFGTNESKNIWRTPFNETSTWLTYLLYNLKNTLISYEWNGTLIWPLWNPTFSSWNCFCYCNYTNTDCMLYNDLYHCNIFSLWSTMSLDPAWGNTAIFYWAFSCTTMK